MKNAVVAMKTKKRPGARCDPAAWIMDTLPVPDAGKSKIRDPARCSTISHPKFSGLYSDPTGQHVSIKLKKLEFRAMHKRWPGRNVSPLKGDGVAKSPPYCVTAFFHDLDILDVCLRPGKTTKPFRTKFLPGHPASFFESIKDRVDLHKFIDELGGWTCDKKIEVV